MSTSFTLDCLSSCQSHGYELTPECNFRFRCTSIHNQPPSASSPWKLKGNVMLSHSHSCELTNWWIESQQPARRPLTAFKYSSSLTPIMASKCVSKLVQLQPPSAYSQKSHYHGLQVQLQTHLIMVSKFAWSWPPSAYRQTRLITASKCISKYARLPPPSASPNLLEHNLGLHL